MSVVEKASHWSPSAVAYPFRVVRQIGRLILWGAQDPFFQFIALGLIIPFSVC